MFIWQCRKAYKILMVNRSPGTSRHFDPPDILTGSKLSQSCGAEQIKRHLTAMATECLFASQKSVKINVFFNRTPDLGTLRACSSVCRAFDTNRAYSGRLICLKTKNDHLQNMKKIRSSKIEPTDYTQEFRKRSSADEVCLLTGFLLLQNGLITYVFKCFVL
jgi:hypothetical protein